MRLRNYPTVGIDHWGHCSLVIGLPGVRLSSGVRGWRSSTPCGRDKKRDVGVGTRKAVKNRFRKSRTWFQIPERRKSCAISSDLKPRIDSDFDNENWESAFIRNLGSSNFEHSL
ncbi:hypothetical protein AVEN_9608-1 [Araneus ventricosus]|uniref:Uncharacterized protein n=1 Tax=Araneus ventricosus TaxID=182803 RepID=A0A4Y2KQG4_ARAVE|nr:hypothetical protein AVEN_9608-1 [Araneus ventricosus]